MSDEIDAVKKTEVDGFFEHLRKQDEEIAKLRDDLSFVVQISQNLEGFSKFCALWGGRINRFLKWVAVVGPAFVLFWQWLSEPVKALFKVKGGN